MRAHDACIMKSGLFVAVVKRVLAAAPLAALLAGLVLTSACSTSLDSAPSTVEDPAGTGPYAVYTRPEKVPGFTSKATLYAPSRDGGQTPVAGVKFPLVVVLPGSGASYTMYEHLILHTASWGFAVLGMNFENDNNHTHNAIQVQRTIDWALGSDSGFADLIDPARIATAGHSKGGKIAIYAATGDHNTLHPEINFEGDPRIRLIIGWDPIDAGGPPCPIAGGSDPGEQGKPGNCFGYAIIPYNTAGTDARMLLFDGRKGNPDGFTCQPSGHTGTDLYAGARSAELVHFDKAGHTSWMVGPIAALGEVLCGKYEVDPEAVIALTKRTNVAFLQKYFEGLPTDRYLTGEAIRQSCQNPDALCSVQLKPEP